MITNESKISMGVLAALTMILLVFALLVTGCDSPPNQNNQAPVEPQSPTAAVTDMVGRTVEVPTEVDKIVGIGSSSLRIISYLEATDLVVGVEQSEHKTNVTWAYNYVYQDVFKDLPVIGDGGSKGVTPNEEAILGVSPQVIFASIDKDTADALQERTGFRSSLSL